MRYVHITLDYKDVVIHESKLAAADAVRARWAEDYARSSTWTPEAAKSAALQLGKWLENPSPTAPFSGRYGDRILPVRGG